MTDETMNMKSKVELSVIVPVTERFDKVDTVYKAYKDGIEATNLPYEFIYVLDGDFPDIERELLKLKKSGEQITIIKLAKWFGEATALNIGFEHSSGKLLLTLPAYFQIVSDEIPKLFDSIKQYDMVIARRWPRRGSLISKIQTKAFHLPLNLLTDLNFKDLGCGVRLIKRHVMEEINIYGDQHRFLPLLAYRQGFKVHEIDATQAPEDAKQRLYSPGIYLRRLLDILSIFFLLKFTKKPLRFFGLLGSSLFFVGAIIAVYLAFERIFLSIPLADRPLLLLASLLIVLGVQIFAIGLIGEIIIFTHAKDLKEYTIEEIID